MLRIEIKIWPYGDRNHERLIKLITIANIGGDRDVGNYQIKQFKEGTDLKGEHEQWYPDYKKDVNVEKQVKATINRKQPIENFIFKALDKLLNSW